MRRAQKADQLLVVACAWQNGGSMYVRMGSTFVPCDELAQIVDDVDCEEWESACLSEVAAMGFDIEDADA